MHICRRVRSAFAIALLATPLSSARAEDAASSIKTFKSPPAPYRPLVEWGITGVPGEGEARRQIRAFGALRAGGFVARAQQGLGVAYLGEAWLALVRAAVDEGRTQGLAVWVADEDRGETGAAGGLVTRSRPELAAMGLGFEDLPIDQLAAALANPETVGLYDLESDRFRRVQGPTEKPRGKLIRFFARRYEPAAAYNGAAPLDLLDAEAAGQLLDVTFTRGYDGPVRDAYGQTLAGALTRAPTLQPHHGRPATDLPWSRRLPDLFRARRGYDLRDRLPLLVFPLPGHEQTRYDFWRTVAGQLEAAFSKPYADAMATRRLMVAGPLGGGALSDDTGVAGSIMLGHLHQQIPGVQQGAGDIADLIARKRASSIAHQFGRDRVMAELGATATFEAVKSSADLHFALGANLLVAAQAPSSLSGEGKRVAAAPLSEAQPFWPYAPSLNEYLARGAYFVTRGRPHKKVLLLEPLGSVWSLWAPGPKARGIAHVERGFQETASALLASHRDFDLADEVILERFGKTERSELLVGTHGRYETVVVPPATRWSEEVINLLARFAAAGGKVVARSPQPPLSARWQRSMSGVVVGPGLPELEAALKWAAPRQISIADDAGQEIADIVYQHRTDDEISHYFFLANTSRDRAHRAHIKVWAAGYIEQWDLATGEVRPLASTTVDLPPAGSFALAVHRNSPPVAVETPAEGPAQTELVPAPFKFKRMHPNVLALATCRFAIAGGAERGPVSVAEARAAALEAAGVAAETGVQPWARTAQGTAVPLTLRFELDSELVRPSASLVVEHAAEFQILVNGKPAGPVSGWHWDRDFATVDLRGLLARGKNTVELHTTFTPRASIENIFVVGDFATRKTANGRDALMAEPKQLQPGGWADQGYRHYAGVMSYEIPVAFKEGERVRLRLERPVAALAVVRVSGREVARLPWQPWQADITAALKPGKNVVTVDLVSTLENALGGGEPRPFGLAGVQLVRTPAKGAARHHASLNR